jgi:IMP dehydrogenase/GMP reductase
VPTEVSRIKSRKEATTTCEFLNEKLSLPVISSPMESVTGLDMAKELTNLGCLGILNRFDSSLRKILNDNETAKKLKQFQLR